MDGELSNEEIIANEYINKITMELLMSKPKYSKYLESNDPKNREIQRLYEDDICKYKDVIECLIKEELNNVTSEMNRRSHEMKKSFNIFVKECVKYIRMTELNISNTNYNDDETMFENCDEIEEKIKSINSSSKLDIESDTDEETSEIHANSLWGDGVIKYDLRMLARRKL